MTFEERLYVINKNLVEHGYYNGRVVNAVKLLQKYCPDVDPEKCCALFLEYNIIYREILTATVGRDNPAGSGPVDFQARYPEIYRTRNPEITPIMIDRIFNDVTGART